MSNVCKYLATLLLCVFVGSVHALDGATNGVFNVDLSGSATYRIPIKVPQGINGVEPELSISYNSSAGNGILGMGWGIGGLSQITRCGATIPLEGRKSGLDDPDRLYCFNGQRLVDASVSGKRTEIDSLVMATEKYGRSVQVSRQNGTIYTYGGTKDTELGDAILALSSIENELKGQLISIYYLDPAPGQRGEYQEYLYPKEIDYGNRKIVFNYGSTRQDSGTRYLNGIKVSLDRRLDSITTFVDYPENSNETIDLALYAVRTYKFKYNSVVDNKLSRLESVTECAGLGSSEASDCLASINFSYPESNVASYALSSVDGYDDSPFAGVGEPFNNVNAKWSFWGDYNNDAHLDRMVIPYDSSGVISLYYGSDSPDALIPVTTNVGLTPFYRIPPSAELAGSPGFNFWNELADVDGDSLVDIFSIKDDGTVYVYPGQPNGTFNTAGVSYGKRVNYDSSKGFRFWNQLIDINGDGLMDIVEVHSAGQQADAQGTSKNYNNLILIHYGRILSSGFSFRNCSFTDLNCAFVDVLSDFSEDYGFRQNNLFADMNADGVVDIFTAQGSQATTHITKTVSTRYSSITADRGVLGGFVSGFTSASPVEALTPITATSGYTGYFTYLNQLIDVNGDGYLDIVRLKSYQRDIDPTWYENLYRENKVVAGPNSTRIIRYGQWSTKPCSSTDYMSRCEDATIKGVHESTGNDPKLAIHFGLGDGSFSDVTISDEVELSLAGFVNKGQATINLDVLITELNNGTSSDYSCSKKTISTGQDKIWADTSGYIATTESQFTCIVGSAQGERGISHGNQFADIDGNGVIDLIRYDLDYQFGSEFANLCVAKGKGNGTFGPCSTLYSDGVSTPLRAWEADKGFRTANAFIDINGDGFTDIHTGSGVYVANWENATLLSTVTDGFGLKTSVVYKTMSDPSVLAQDEMESVSPSPSYSLLFNDARQVVGRGSVVASYTQADSASGDTLLNDYRYVYKNSKIDLYRGGLGFEKIAKIDMAPTDKTRISITERGQAFPFTGKTLSQSLRFTTAENALSDTASGFWALREDGTTDSYLSRSSANWSQVQRPSENSYFPYVTESQNIEYELSGSGLSSSAYRVVKKIYSDPTPEDNSWVAPYDFYGNPKKIELISQGMNGDGSEKSSIITTFDSDYSATDTALFYGQLDNQTKTVTDAGKLRQTGTAFDQGRVGTVTVSDGSLTDQDDPHGLSLSTTYRYHLTEGYVSSITQTGLDPQYGTDGTKNTGTDVGVPRLVTYTHSPSLRGSRYWLRTETSLVNGVTHEESQEYDIHFGVPIEINDVNSLKTTFDYDELGRLEFETSFASGSTTNGLITTTTYSDNCPAVTTKTCLSKMVSSPTGASVSTTLDVLRRPTLVETKAYNGASTYVKTMYGIGGTYTKVSEPYTSSASYWTQTDYDLLGRKANVFYPGNMYEFYDYSGDSSQGSLETQVTTPNSKTTYIQNNRGLTTGVKTLSGEDWLSASPSVETQYEYAPFNLLKTASLAGTPETAALTTQYDIYGNAVERIDADLGHWSYRYNAFGELKWQKDSENQITQFEYDTLGRLITKTAVKDDTANNVVTTWIYGNTNVAGSGMGLLSAIEQKGLQVQAYGYDEFKRLETETTTSGATNYVTTTGYNAKGQLETLSYPNAGLDIQYGYYDNGLLKKITDVTEGANAFIWQATKYSLRNQVEGETWGTDTTGVRRYYSDSGRLSAISSVGIQDLAYGYDGANNLEWRRNNSKTERFTYDRLNRLRKVRVDGEADLVNEYKYDEQGNITYNKGSGDFAYDEIGLDGRLAGPHAVSSVGAEPALYSAQDVNNTIQRILGNSTAGGIDCVQDGSFNVLDAICVRNGTVPEGGTYYIYDDNGSMTQVIDAGLNITIKEITYNHFNKPKSITQGVDSVAFGYGPNEQRLTKSLNNGQVKTTYIGKHYEKIEYSDPPGTSEQRYFINAGDRLVAQVNINAAGTKKTYYAHTDMLGSVDVMSDGAGQVTGEHAMSFGEFGQAKDRAGNNPISLDQGLSTRGYTGHEMDHEFGLINMNARLYDPTIGRFISADTVIPDTYDPQSLNRYSYVLNNPFRYTDPTGHSPADGYDFMNVPNPYSEDEQAWGRVGFNMGVRGTNGVSSSQGIVASGNVGEALGSPSANALSSAYIDWYINICLTGNCHGNDYFGQYSLRDYQASEYLGGKAANGMLFAIPAGLVTGKTAQFLWQLRGGITPLLPLVGMSGGDVVTKSGAQNIANGPKLAGQLRLESANAPFKSNGQLTDAAIQNSRKIIDSSKIQNPNIPKGYSKYSTETAQSPSGNVQTHFYRNDKTGEAFYGQDYKTILNSMSGAQK